MPGNNLRKKLPVSQPRPPAPANRGRPPAARINQPARDARKPQYGDSVFCLEAEEGDEDPHAVVSGMFLVNTLPTKVLFDAGATHSFINPATAKQIACVVEDLNMHLCVLTPVGSVYQTDRVVLNCSIMIQNREFLADLVVLNIQGYDVILGMDWLTKYRATTDCKQKMLTIVTPEGENLVVKGCDSNHLVPLISATL